MTKIYSALFSSLIFSASSAYALPDSLLSIFVAETHASCPQALPNTNAGFCASFKAAAICHCTSAGLPSGLCQDVNTIYNRMIGLFGSIQRACDYQKDIPASACVAAWNCYRAGGKNPEGNLCSGTGKACP